MRPHIITEHPTAAPEQPLQGLHTLQVKIKADVGDEIPLTTWQDDTEDHLELTRVYILGVKS